MTSIVTDPNRNNIDYWFGDPSQPDSDNNTYLETINDIRFMHYKSGAYGGAWGTIGSDLPSTPNDGCTVLRYNTDTSTKRLYSYDSINGWESIEYT